jgi:hypothetical protein
MQNMPLKYEQTFVLQHLQSCKYLCYSKISENSNEYFL